MLFEGAAALALGFTASLGLVPLTRALATRAGFVCQPKADRWSRRSVALLGGVAIFASYLTVLVIRIPFALNQSWSLVAGGAFLFALGLIDDLINIRPATKLIGQIMGACFAYYLGHQIAFPGLGFLNLPLTIFWVVAITNAYNLIDNMDGLAAGVGVISLAFMAGSIASGGNLTLIVAATALLGSLAGFLVFNFNPASIFMGDAGSMFIGFTLSVLALHGGENKGALASVAVPCLVLMVPLLDMTLVSITRILTGRSVAQGGRDHSSHRLVSLGLSERAAVLVLYGLAVAAGASSMLLSHVSSLSAVLAVAGIVIAFSLFGVYLSQMTFDTPLGYFEAKGTSFPTQILFELTFKRRLLEVMLDLALIVLSYCFAYALRFDFQVPDVFVHSMQASLPIVVASTFLCLFAVGVYRGIWKLTGPREIATFFAGSMAAAVLSVFLVVIMYRFEGFSRSVFPLFALLLFVAMSLSRLSFRFISGIIISMRPAPEGAIPTLIYGAGDFGELLVAELRRQNGHAAARPVGFVDDNDQKCHQQIHGVPVLGGVRDLVRIHSKTSFKQVIVSSSKIGDDNLQMLKEFCRQHDIPIKRYSWTCEDVG